MKSVVISRYGFRPCLFAGVLLVVGISLLAQDAPDLNSALAALASPDVDARASAFYSLLSLAPQNRGSVAVGAEIHELLRLYPDQAERIKSTLIGALETESRYLQSQERSGQQTAEAFSDYWANLMWAVGEFRDPRAVKGLLEGVDTGSIAVDGLADLCPASADALIERARQPDRTFRGGLIRQRESAMRALGDCLKRAQAMRSSPQALARIRAAALEAVGDSDPMMRESAISVLFFFRRDTEVRAKLAQVAASDSYQEGYEVFRVHPGQLTVREAARTVLNAPDNDDDSYFVMRSADTRECRIQKGSDRPVEDRYIGPQQSGGPDDWKQMLCTHVDTSKFNPDLCWSTVPANACQ